MDERGDVVPAAARATATHDEEARFEAKVLRAFLRDGRLTAIPAQDRKRLVILRWLMDTVFVKDRDYPEKEVNMRLALIHPDVAALRRYLVNARLMMREAGEYRRTPAPAGTAAPAGLASATGEPAPRESAGLDGEAGQEAVPEAS